MFIKASFIEEKKFIDSLYKLKDIKFSLFFDCIPTPEELLKNPINIFAHDEPDEYFGHHTWLKNNTELFDVILTWNKDILDKVPHSMLLPYGESWVDHLGDNILYENFDKKFEISFIRGNKLKSVGHQHRHDIYDNKNKINIPTKFYSSTSMTSAEEIIKGKIDLHKSSMFSLVIENTSHPNYFTEKLSDCIMMKSIPVYWGCTNIGDYYDIDGIITFKDAQDAINKINSLTPELFHSKKDVIESNWKKAFKYKNYVNRISKVIEEIFVLNNLYKENE